MGDKEKTQFYKSGFECGKRAGMAQAIDALTRKQSEWRERAEYHRKTMIDAHCAHNKSKETEHRQLASLAVDTARELGYAIEILRG